MFKDKKTLDTQFSKGEKVLAAVDLDRVPAGTTGKVKLVNGFEWIRYWVFFDNGEKIIGQNIRDLITVNGVRIVLEDGTWGLVRASSNTPNLVVVVESPTSEANKTGMFREIEARLAKYDEIGEYDQ